MLILLVCGGRDYENYVALSNAIILLPQPSIIIEGGALGADRLARRWAIEHGVHYATVPALWDYYKKGAGPRRNSAMLILNPNYCLAMPGGTGTHDMKQKCIENNITVWAPYDV